MFLYLIIFAISAASTILLTPVVRTFALKIKAVESPNQRKIHKKPVPRLGGLAIYFGFLVGIFTAVIAAYFLAIKLNYHAIFGIISSGTIVLILGFLDDTMELMPWVKFLVQIIAASIAIYFGAVIGFISNPFSGLIVLGAWSVPITLFWVVGMTNAINLIDGLDGLASGVTAIASIALFFVAVRTHQVGAAIILLALAGSALGFLKYNFNPASIFLGDSGSLFMGFVLACASVVGVLKSTLVIALIIPVLVLGVPIFDTASAIVRRVRLKAHIFKADKRHIHHKLLEAGLSQREAVMAIYFICILLSCGALVVTFMKPAEAIALFVIIFVVAAIGIMKIKENINLKLTEGKR